MVSAPSSLAWKVSLRRLEIGSDHARLPKPVSVGKHGPELRTKDDWSICSRI